MTNNFDYDYLYENGREFNSDAIDTLAYNSDTQHAYVEFCSGGEYYYAEVPESVFLLWVEAPSLGGFYRESIAGNYTSTRVYGVSLFNKNDADEVAPTGGTDRDPNTKWLTGLNPVTGEKEFSVSFPATSRYTVEWTGDGALGGKPAFDAASEADALVQFNAALAAAERLGLGGADNVKIVSVTHYFD